MKTISIGKSLSRKDNNPLTADELKRVLNNIPEDIKIKPVLMYSDEEGNSIGKLYQIDITTDGVILTPADAQ